MGGSSSTTNIIVNNENPPVPPPPGIDNVVKTLLDWGNGISKQQYVFTGDSGKDSQNLNTMISEITIDHFQDLYQYAFNGSDTLPKHTTDQSQLSPHNDFVNTPTSKSASIDRYVNDNIFPDDGNLPDEYNLKARNDLISSINAYLVSQTDGWKQVKYHRKYKASGQETWTVDAALTWAAIPAYDQASGQNLSTLFLYFVGVYYPSK